MRPCLAIASTLLLGCAALRPTLPDLTIEVRHERSRISAAEGGAARIEILTGLVGLRLPMDPALEAAFLDAAARERGRPPAPCVSRLLCLWERRNRARALSRLEGSP